MVDHLLSTPSKPHSSAECTLLREVIQNPFLLPICSCAHAWINDKLGESCGKVERLTYPPSGPRGSSRLGARYDDPPRPTTSRKSRDLHLLFPLILPSSNIVSIHLSVCPTRVRAPTPPSMHTPTSERESPQNQSRKKYLSVDAFLHIPSSADGVDHRARSHGPPQHPSTHL
jgi:hypothetical protein